MQRKNKDFKYGMKAAPLYREQLADRHGKFAGAGMKAVLELHLFGTRDIFDKSAFLACVDNCKGFEAEYYVHFPVQDNEGFGVFDPMVHSDDYFKTVLDFTRSIGAKGIIMHRAFGVDKAMPRAEAAAAFNEKTAVWAELATGLTVYMENYSYIWLPAGFGKAYSVSPIEHFFPWEVAEFCGFLRKSGIENVEPMLDIAHANITSSMFNMKRAGLPVSRDGMFANILESDLEKTDKLSVFDFISDAIRYYHVSDSKVFAGGKVSDSGDEYLRSEGLPLGKGGLDFGSILSKAAAGSTLIMEIVPPDGNNNNGAAQFDGVATARELHA